MQKQSISFNLDQQLHVLAIKEQKDQQQSSFGWWLHLSVWYFCLNVIRFDYKKQVKRTLDEEMKLRRQSGSRVKRGFMFLSSLHEILQNRVGHVFTQKQVNSIHDSTQWSSPTERNKMVEDVDIIMRLKSNFV